MERQTKIMVAKVGLSLAPLLLVPGSIEEVHERSIKTEVVTQSELPGLIQPAFLGDYNPRPTYTEQPKPVESQPAKPLPAATDEAQPVVNEKASRFVAEQQKLQFKKRHYVQTILLPMIRNGTEFKIITVPSSSRDPINAPGQFIVQRNGGCAVQYYVNLGLNTISPTVWGSRRFFRPGAYENAIRNHNARQSVGLIHIEGTGGKPFSKNHPAKAIGYVAKTYAPLCRIAARARH